MNAAVAPQLTFRAISLAIVLAMILAAANTYLGLFAGMTIASAIPAAARPRTTTAIAFGASWSP